LRTGRRYSSARGRRGKTDWIKASQIWRFQNAQKSEDPKEDV